MEPHPGMKVNSPDFLGDVGAIIADLRGLPLTTLMPQAVRNAQNTVWYAQVISRRFLGYGLLVYIVYIIQHKNSTRALWDGLG